MIQHYAKESGAVRTVGFSAGNWSKNRDADGRVIWTATADGASVNVYYRDSTLDTQTHTGLKAGSTVVRDPKTGLWEIEENK